MRRRGFVDMSTRSRDLAVHDVEDRDVGGDLNRYGLENLLLPSSAPSRRLLQDSAADDEASLNERLMADILSYQAGLATMSLANRQAFIQTTGLICFQNPKTSEWPHLASCGGALQQAASMYSTFTTWTPDLSKSAAQAMMKTLAAVDMAAYAIPSDDNVIVAVFTEETDGFNGTVYWGNISNNFNSGMDASCWQTLGDDGNLEAQGCYPGSYNLTCNGSPQTMLNETGEYHEQLGMCCNTTLCNGNLTDAPEVALANEEAELETFVCDKALHEITPLGTLQFITLALAFVVSVSFGLVVDFCKR